MPLDTIPISVEAARLFRSVSFFVSLSSSVLLTRSRVVSFVSGSRFLGAKNVSISHSRKKKESSHVRAQRKKERERGREVIICKDNNKASDENDALFSFFFFFFVFFSSWSDSAEGTNT